MIEPNHQPITVSESIEILIEILSDDQKEKISQMSEGEIASQHLGLGMWIRNNFGLRSKGSFLLKDTGLRNADAASSLILKLLWCYLRDDPDMAKSFIENSRIRSSDNIPVSEIPEYLRRHAD